MNGWFRFFWLGLLLPLMLVATISEIVNPAVMNGFGVQWPVYVVLWLAWLILGYVGEAFPKWLELALEAVVMTLWGLIQAIGRPLRKKKGLHP